MTSIIPKYNNYHSHYESINLGCTSFLLPLGCSGLTILSRHPITEVTIHMCNYSIRFFHITSLRWLTHVQLFEKIFPNPITEETNTCTIIGIDFSKSHHWGDHIVLFDLTIYPSHPIFSFTSIQCLVHESSFTLSFIILADLSILPNQQYILNILNTSGAPGAFHSQRQLLEIWWRDICEKGGQYTLNLTWFVFVGKKVRFLAYLHSDHLNLPEFWQIDFLQIPGWCSAHSVGG